jgi:hypothetical protein
MVVLGDGENARPWPMCSSGSKGNRAVTSRILKVSDKTLLHKISEHGLPPARRAVEAPSEGASEAPVGRILPPGIHVPGVR